MRNKARLAAGLRPVILALLAALLLVAVAGCSAASDGQAARHTGQSLAATQKVYISPVTAAGRPASGFRVTTRASHATCTPGSEAIGQAYRCFAGNYVYDPCWAEKASTPTVLCLPDPWSTTDAELSTSAALSAIPSEGGTAAPWGVELADGKRCLLLQGAHSEFDGHVIDYYCNTRLSLLRGLTETGPVWRARSVVDQSGSSASGPAEQIRIAWFGRPNQFR